VVDGERRVTLVNGSARGLLNLPDDVLGRTLPEVLRIPAILDLVDAPADLHEPMVEIDIPGPPKRTLLANRTPQPATEGSVLVLHDVTLMRRLEAVRKDFVANVSHELRTPVSVIRASAENLADGAIAEPESAQRFLDAVLRNTERLSRIISDLLDLSRIESGNYPLTLEPLDLAVISGRVIAELTPEAEQRHTSITVEIDALPLVHGDLGAVEQILVNYVDNALKYAPDGGDIHVGGHERDGRVRITVRDNGPGIPPGHRPRLFERFYRVDPGRSRAVGGTGLGLAIVKHLAHSMGGVVGMEPAEPSGSVFWVELMQGYPMTCAGEHSSGAQNIEGT
jgi:two-component system, OmpR family, phosphate regulon sensor histidine kinase PhoR